MNAQHLPLFVLLTATFLASACATRPTTGGGRETVGLGGAVTVATKSFQPTAQTTIPVDTTKLVGLGRPGGARTSVLWAC